MDGYVWVGREKLLKAHSNCHRQAVADLADMRMLRIKRMMTIPCTRDKGGWFRKNKLRVLTLEEATYKWDEPYYNSLIDDNGVWTPYYNDYEKDLIEDRVTYFGKICDTLDALTEYEVFVSLKNINKVKKYL